MQPRESCTEVKWKNDGGGSEGKKAFPPPPSFSPLTFYSTRNERRLRLQNSAEILALDPHATDLTNGQSAFRISFQPDWLIKQRRIFHDTHDTFSNPGAQIGAQNKDFGADLKTCLTKGLCRLWHLAVFWDWSLCNVIWVKCLISLFQRFGGQSYQKDESLCLHD